MEREQREKKRPWYWWLVPPPRISLAEAYEAIYGPRPRYEPAFVLCDDGSMLPIHDGIVMSESGLDIKPDDDVLYRRVS